MGMFNKMKFKMNNSGGFTMVELLMAVLIMAMAGSVVAGGMPAAVQAYTEIVDNANAQVLLSTTMTRLRDELDTAKDVRITGPSTEYSGAVSYKNSSGSESVLFLVPYSDSERTPGIYIREYNDIIKDTADKKYEHLLVSNEASNKNLYMKYESVEINDSVITFSKLEVYRKLEVIVSIDEFKVRGLAL